MYRRSYLLCPPGIGSRGEKGRGKIINGMKNKKAAAAATAAEGYSCASMAVVV